MTLPDLSRTARAIEAYDEHCARMPPLHASNLVWADWDATEKKLGKKVGEAFGLDTADRNNTRTCADLVRPGNPNSNSFVRRMVRQWREQR